MLGAGGQLFFESVNLADLYIFFCVCIERVVGLAMTSQGHELTAFSPKEATVFHTS